MRVLQCVLASIVAIVCALSFVESATARNTNGTWQSFVGSVNPPNRKHHTMVYDVSSNRAVMYGGENHNAQGQDVALGDVWVFDVACPSWQQLTPDNDDNVAENGGFPLARHGHQAIYIGSPPRMLIFGGRADFSSPEVFLKDVWSLTLTGTPTWTKLSNGPGTNPVSCAHYPFFGRTHASASLLQGQLVLFGGRSDWGSHMQDTWGFLPGNNVWGWLSGSSIGDIINPNWNCDIANTPEHRYWHSSIVDDFSRMVVFGGKYDNIPISTAWATANGSNWTKVGEAPTSPVDLRRQFHVAVGDPVADRMIMHGGYNAEGGPITSSVSTLDLPAQLPAWQNAVWTLLSPSGTNPGNMAEHAGVYSPSRDWMIVFGGVDQTGELRSNTTHILNFADTPDVTAPASVTLTGGTGKTTAAVSWTSPGDDGNTGTACRYELRKSISQITEMNFAGATLIPTSAPYTAGNEECVEISGNVKCQTYYYGLKTFDDSGNASALSTIALTQRCNGGEVMCLGYTASVPVPTPATLEYRITGANPASGHTSLEFAVPADFAGQSLEITVYDVAGRRVRTLEQRLAAAGTFNTSWDHRSGDGREVAVGMYFAKLTVGSQSITQKILVAPSR